MTFSIVDNDHTRHSSHCCRWESTVLSPSHTCGRPLVSFLSSLECLGRSCWEIGIPTNCSNWKMPMVWKDG